MSKDKVYKDGPCTLFIRRSMDTNICLSYWVKSRAKYKIGEWFNGHGQSMDSLSMVMFL